MELEVISLSHTEVHVFSNAVSCFGKMSENPQSNYAREDRLRCSRVHHNTELWTKLMVMEFE